MTAEQYANQIKGFINDLPDIVEKILVTEAQTGLSVVKNRSINDGIFGDSEDGNYQDYSTNKMRTSKFKGKERNSAGVDYIKNNRLGTWHEFRKAQGLKSEKVNASYTNRFWTSLAITKIERTERGVLAIVSPSNPEQIEVAEELAKRYGNFIVPTESEQKDLIQDSFANFIIEINKRL